MNSSYDISCELCKEPMCNHEILDVLTSENEQYTICLDCVNRFGAVNIKTVTYRANGRVIRGSAAF